MGLGSGTRLCEESHGVPKNSSTRATTIYISIYVYAYVGTHMYKYCIQAHLHDLACELLETRSGDPT